MTDNRVKNIKWTGIPCTIPNLLSLIRICAAPFLIVCAFTDTRTVFLVLFAVCLVTDFLDGQFARFLKQISLIGTRLDTLGDITMYSSATVGGWLLWPEELKEHSGAVMIVIVVMIASGLLSRIKHGRLPAYHTWCAKTASAALGVFSFLMFAGYSSFPFKAALVLLVIASIEEIIITLVLPESVANVPSLYHAVKESRRSGVVR